MSQSFNDALSSMDFSEIPAVPHALVELLSIFGQPDSGLGEIAEAIRRDPGISARVISAANSPLYRQWGNPSDLNRIVVILGRNTLKTIAVTAAVQQFFANASLAFDVELSEISFRSLKCACAARELALLAGFPFAEEAYLAGLLHRLGQLVLLHNHPETYVAILQLAIDAEDLIGRETDQLGVSFCEVGGALLDAWGLDASLADAVRFQHASLAEVRDATSLVRVTRVAGLLADVSGQLTDDQAELADELFGLNHALMDDLLARINLQVAEQASALGISTSSSQSSNKIGAARTNRRALEQAYRQVALSGVGTTEHASARDLPQVLRAAHRDLSILFGRHRNAFLLLDAKKRCLEGFSLSDQEPISDIRLGLENTSSLGAWAVSKVKACNTLHPPHPGLVSVAERQLAHFLDSEGIVYLPLRTTGSTPGLLALGVGREEWARVSDQMDRLALFAAELAGHITFYLEQERRARSANTDAPDDLTLKARKLVHEANNPLSNINNYLHVLSSKLGDDNPVKEELEIVREELNRVGRIVLRMRDLAAEDSAETAGVDLNALIDDILALFKSSLFITKNISVSVERDDEIPTIHSDRNRIKQILINLIKNSAEALVDGGKISITTIAGVIVDNTTYAEIEVSDNGPGLPDEIRQSLFSPVTSTKGKDHSGLGLAIVNNLVTELQARISCVSSNRNGTRFRILIPYFADEVSS